MVQHRHLALLRGQLAQGGEQRHPVRGEFRTSDAAPCLSCALSRFRVRHQVLIARRDATVRTHGNGRPPA
ncbi:hypothetical protein [Streptomyces sp. NPDC054866]